MLDIITLLICFFTITIAFLRGFIKEIFGVIGITLSFILTYYNYDFFSSMLGIKSQLFANIISSFIMYMIAIISIAVINNGIVYILKPIRLGTTDRMLGITVGFFKGIIFSFLLFLMAKLFYYTFSAEEENITDEKILPKWIMHSKVYTPFYYVEQNLDQILPNYFYDNIQTFGNKITEEIKPKEKEVNNTKTDKKATEKIDSNTLEQKEEQNDNNQETTKIKKKALLQKKNLMHLENIF